MFLLIFIGDFKVYVISRFQTPDGALPARGSRPAPRPTWGRPSPAPARRFARAVCAANGAEGSPGCGVMSEEGGGCDTGGMCALMTQLQVSSAGTPGRFGLLLFRQGRRRMLLPRHSSSVPG